MEITGEENTLLTQHKDVPGIVADVCCLLAEENVNISDMHVFRKGKGTDAVMIIHTDQKISQDIVEKIKERNENIINAMALGIV